MVITIKRVPKHPNMQISQRRLMTEWNKLKGDPSDNFFAEPLEGNIYEWHFTILGPKGSHWENGLYHGKVLFPESYPWDAPHIVFLTENGRFKQGKKICQSGTLFHNDDGWSTKWTIRKMLESLTATFPTNVYGRGHIRCRDITTSEIKSLAIKSHDYSCDVCKKSNVEISKMIGKKNQEDEHKKQEEEKKRKQPEEEKKRKEQEAIELKRKQEIFREQEEKLKESQKLQLDEAKESVVPNNRRMSETTDVAIRDVPNNRRKSETTDVAIRDVLNNRRKSETTDVAIRDEPHKPRRSFS